MAKKLYGYVVKENVIYQWSSESSACEVCKEMDGKIFESTDEIPDRPHPNCKCHIEILEKESDETNKDPIEAHREKRKDRKRNKLEMAKLFGDAKSFEEEIDEYIIRINEVNENIKRIQNSFDANKFDTNDKKRFVQLMERTKQSKRVAETLKQEIVFIEKDISQSKYESNLLNKIDEIYFKLKITRELFDNSLKKQFDECINLSNKLMPVSAALWKLSTSKFQEGLDYISKNGQIYNTTDDLKDLQVKVFIKDKIGKQMQTADSRGIVFNSNSEIARKIAKSMAIREYIKFKKGEFKPNMKFPNISVTFNLQELDLYNAIHKADIIDIKIGNDMTFYAKLVDTYDFNKGSKNPLVILARHYQEKNKIENYYTIINIKIPQSEWIKY